MPKEHFTPDELASRWRISNQTLANWRHAKKGPPYVKLGQILYPLKDIEAYEKANKISPEEFPEPKAPAVPRRPDEGELKGELI